MVEDALIINSSDVMVDDDDDDEWFFLTLAAVKSLLFLFVHVVFYPFVVALMNLISSWCQLPRCWACTWIMFQKFAGNLGCAYQAKNDVAQLDVRRSLFLAGANRRERCFFQRFPQVSINTCEKWHVFFVSDRLILSTNYFIILVNFGENLVFFRA